MLKTETIEGFLAYLALPCLQHVVGGPVTSTASEAASTISSASSSFEDAPEEEEEAHNMEFPSTKQHDSCNALLEFQGVKCVVMLSVFLHPFEKRFVGDKKFELQFRVEAAHVFLGYASTYDGYTRDEDDVAGRNVFILSDRYTFHNGPRAISQQMEVLRKHLVSLSYEWKVCKRLGRIVTSFQFETVQRRFSPWPTSSSMLLLMTAPQEERKKCKNCLEACNTVLPCGCRLCCVCISELTDLYDRQELERESLACVFCNRDLEFPRDMYVYISM